MNVACTNANIPPSPPTPTSLRVPPAAIIDDDVLMSEPTTAPDTNKTITNQDTSIETTCIWKQWRPAAGEPVVETPGLPPGGSFEIPFPLERDWKVCFLNGSPNLATLAALGVVVGCKEHGIGKKITLSLSPHVNSAVSHIQLRLVIAWEALCMWHQELLEGRDVDIGYGVRPSSEEIRPRQQLEWRRDVWETLVQGGVM